MPAAQGVVVVVVVLVVVVLVATGTAEAVRAPVETVTNSIGMTFAAIPRGTFDMGYSKVPLPESLTQKLPYRVNGDYDERPAHGVTLSHDFHMGITEVTNAQYEHFDPGHASVRGRLGFSYNDDDAVIFVNWWQAVAFCAWLSQLEGVTYRLPTEAEWEYACRANTTTYFNTGDDLPKSYWKFQQDSWYPGEKTAGDTPSLKVAENPANAFGLFDMHGNVEEWCADWYGLYGSANATDPLGPDDGDFRVARGGSHSSDVYYLRSANRMGALPEDESWLIGFRVVRDDASHGSDAPRFGAPRDDAAAAAAAAASRRRHSAPGYGGLAADPVFIGPRKYVNIDPSRDHLPMPYHNHDPGIATMANGDVLAIWYSTHDEPGRELGIASAVLKRGESEWPNATLFWNAPDRNDHAPAMFVNESDGSVWHFNGYSAAGTWGNLATVLRKSFDNGQTWTRARLIFSDHGLRHMPVETVIVTREGYMILPTDNTTAGSGGTVMHVSKDNGETWGDNGPGMNRDTLGIHGSVAQLTNGSLLCFGRGNDIDGNMAQSLSSDLASTFQYSRSQFPGIVSAQRAFVMRMHEGPLLFIGFANAPMPVVDSSGTTRNVTGLFAAVSTDEGQTWDRRRILTDDKPGWRYVETLDGVLFNLSQSTAEPRGYMAGRQSALDGMIHVISSRQHYAFNAAWAMSAPPPIHAA